MKAEVGAQPQVEEGPRVEAGEVAEPQVEAEVGAEVLRAQVEEVGAEEAEVEEAVEAEPSFSREADQNHHLHP